MCRRGPRAREAMDKEEERDLRKTDVVTLRRTRVNTAFQNRGFTELLTPERPIDFLQTNFSFWMNTGSQRIKAPAAACRAGSRCAVCCSPPSRTKMARPRIPASSSPPIAPTGSRRFAAPSSVLFRSGWYRSRPRTSLRLPGAADHTSESGAAAAAPAPTQIQEVATAASSRSAQAAPAGRSADRRRWENLSKELAKKNCRKRKLERVGLLAERVARLRLARAREKCVPLRATPSYSDNHGSGEAIA